MVPKSNGSIWRVDFRDPGRKPGTPFKLIPSTRNELWPTYSPDGKRIAFSSDRSGNFEVWVCDSDGSNPVQLTSFRKGRPMGRNGPRMAGTLSLPVLLDKTVTSMSSSANGGAASRLTTDPADDTWPCWSRDGQWIYFRSDRSGQSEIWKMPAAGGDAVQITRNRGDVPQESPDGKFIYYLKGDPYPTSCSVWRMPVGGGEETKVLDSVHCGGPLRCRRTGHLFFHETRRKGPERHPFPRIRDRQDQQDPHNRCRMSAPWIAVSPDGRTILYTQIDEAGSDLMLVENFR